jgi:hypothetical protein
MLPVTSTVIPSQTLLMKMVEIVLLFYKQIFK